MKKLFWPIIAVILAAVAVAVTVLVMSEESDSGVKVHVYDVSPKVVGEYDCVVYAPERLGDAFQIEAAPGCKSFEVLAATPPRKGTERCHVTITRVTVPLVEPPVLMPLGTVNPFQGKGCKRAVWSFKYGMILIVDQAAIDLTIDYINQGSIKVKQPPKVGELPPDTERRES